jgi:two-component system chemotaxis sensor kinase CheA
MGYRDDFTDTEELMHTFATEGQELLDDVEPRLIELKDRTGDGGIDGEVLNSIFRIFHTIKGSAGFLELNNLQEVTHEAETLLDHYRKGLMVPSAEQIGLLLSTTDFIRKLMGNIERYLHDRGFEPEAHHLVEALARVSSDRKGGPEKVQETVEKPAAEAPSEASPQEVYQLIVTPEMLAQYCQESLDLIDGLEQAMLDLEHTPEEHELIDRAFRSLHTLKGNSGLLGLADMERLSHRTESLFDYMRKGSIRPEMENIKMVLSIIDLLRSTVTEISKGGDGRIRGCDVLAGFIDEVIAEAMGTKVTPGEAAALPAGETTSVPEVAEPVIPETASPVSPAPEMTAAVSPGETPLAAPIQHVPQENAVSPEAQKPESREERAPRPADVPGAGTARKDIRVDLDKVDKLVDLVGELALAEMMVVQNPALRGLEAEEFDRAVHHLDRVISELQYVSMSLRMVPIAATFRKLIRLVHDLSYKANKSVKLVTLGEETEVDKTVADFIADPLVHIVRNAIDHGIEHPEERKEKGKSEGGAVTIDARHEGGEVWIEVSDDGRGLSREKILKKARQMGMVNGEGAELKDEEVYKLILEPGFSTADKITEVSGRGVGMDVVKRNLEKINGHVDIATTPGKGSRFTLRIPLTLALMDGMLVQVGGTRYIVPLLAIRECIRPRKEDITVTPDGQEIVQVRKELIPVIRLHLLHNIIPEHEDLEDSLLLVVEHRGMNFCIAVDGVLGQQQAVIKGLSEYVGNVRGASGCTILGDGTVSLILDVGSLVEMVSLESREAVMTV